MRIVLLCVLALSLQGCGTLLAGDAAKASKVQVVFQETTPDGYVTKIESKASGDSANTFGVGYLGPTTKGDDTVTPWNLTVGGNSSMNSPNLLPIAGSYGKLLEQIPSTVEGLAAQVAAIASIPSAVKPGDPGLSPDIKDMLIKFATERFIKQ